MKALSSLVAEDVEFINVSGTWLKGRKDFEAHHTRLHAGPFKESVWATTDVQVTCLKPDVAIVYVSWSAKGQKEPDGTPQPPRRGIFMRVVTKEGGEWLIKASQNTIIREAASTK